MICSVQMNELTSIFALRLKDTEKQALKDKAQEDGFQDASKWARPVLLAAVKRKPKGRISK